MRPVHFVLPVMLAALLAACDDGQQTDDADTSRLTSQQQVHQDDPTATTPTPAAGPEERLQEFFEALRSNQPQQAAALVAQQPLQVSEAELLESLQQWSQTAAQQEFEILDSRQESDFAVVRARFMRPAEGLSQPVIRPVILFREEGDWKVVWELLGMLPEQAAQFSPQMTDRLAPLYSWYTQQQRTQISATDESPGGSPATDEALRRQGATDQPRS